MPVLQKSFLYCAFLCLAVVASFPLSAEVSVTTQHNDSLRTGQNLNETVLAPSNVNSSSFGKLFSQKVDGSVFVQPLYVQNVSIVGKGTHNVVFVATQHDSVYAFDADSNTGPNAIPLWQVSLLDTSHGATSGATSVPSSMVSTADIKPEIGITGTPAIDLAAGTLFVVSKSLENGKAVQRLHALDLTSGVEKPGSPVVIKASVPGTGTGSSNGVLPFDPLWELNRPGLLLLNGSLFLGFAAHGDNGPWHGWILSYDENTLQQQGAYCPTANGFGSGFWMSGAGLAADESDPSAPNGRLYVTSGNGSFNASKAYTNSMSFGDDTIRLNNNKGVLSVSDMFTPFNQAALSAADQDFGSGGLLILPDQGGAHPHIAVQVGKQGTIYVLDRENLGGYNQQSDNVLQVITGQTAGLWSIPAYWNNHIYMAGRGDYLKAFSTSGSGLSTTPTATSKETFGYPGATPSISANGASDGIVWTLQVGAYSTNGPAVLQANDAENIGTTLYRSDENTLRDKAGPAVKFTTPTIANGKVYVSTVSELDVYGLLQQQQAAKPVFSPQNSTFVGSTTVSITDSTPGADIYYTTDGSTPTPDSRLYNGPLTLTKTTTLKAIAVASGYAISSVASATYTSSGDTQAPAFSLPGGTYSSAQTVSITDGTANVTIYYTVDGSTPSTGSTLYSQPVTITRTTTLKAIAVKNGLAPSAVTSAQYVINVTSGNTIDFSNGFANAQPAMTFNGNTGLDDTRLQLTSGVAYQASSAFSATAVNIQSFTTDFSFQLSNPAADGITFTIQGVGPTALGSYGGGLGYAANPSNASAKASIGKSIAIKFDLFSNSGEGNDSTGLYLNGAIPTLPSIDLSKSGINLHSGDTISAHFTYDGTTLRLTLSDAVAGTTYSTSWPVNIPATVGGSTAYVGFTGGSGALTASQKILTWTFASTGSVGVQTTATPVFGLAPGSYAGVQSVTLSDATTNASIYYTLDGSDPSVASTLYTGPVSISKTTTVKAIAVASGYNKSAIATGTYTISNGVTIDFSNGFAKAAGAMTLNGSVVLNDTRLQLTHGTAAQVGTAFYSTPVNIQSFTTDFTMQFIKTLTDGITFTLQNVGPTAYGHSGGGLGYGPDHVGGTDGIPKSVAVKFDVFNNAGEGIDSTGLYQNGAAPTVPAIDLSGSGINLRSGNALAVHITYNGATLAMTITDAVTKAAFNKTWTVNIPAAVGANTAYVGFTGGNGTQASDQEIETWTFGSTTP